MCQDDFEAQSQKIIGNLMGSYEKNLELFLHASFEMPNKNAVIEVTEELRQILFPGYFEQERLSNRPSPCYLDYVLTRMYAKLSQQIERALWHDRIKVEQKPNDQEIAKEAKEICIAFFHALPYVQEKVMTDVAAGFDGDPAADNMEQVIFSYPGLIAISIQRLAHELYLLSVPLIPRIMTEYAHSLTGIDIHPGAQIGNYFFIDHGTGVVIGETTEIGDYVKIYQGVTLGALSTSGGQLRKGTKRHPTLRDYVTIYSGASVLGGKTIIGKNVTIGGNVFITKSIPPDTTVSLISPELQYKNSPDGQSLEGFDWRI